MQPKPGDKLGAYEIVSLLGKGGMGEVWRARDTKLKRDAALKVLPEAFAHDEGRMARFQREAELLASLNHPNIAHIYGVEGGGLAMELVEGETLSCPLPLDKAVNYAIQIAQALEYAHARGVIHRDLKPTNIKVTPEGVAKLLDFGLAKAIYNPLTSLEDPDNLSTLAMNHTEVGMVMGTPAYMPPEQAAGLSVDARADIWSFGALLYEMLTGTRAFGGTSAADTLGNVMQGQPDWKALSLKAPASVQKLIRRCLTKDLKQRLQAIGEARIALETPPDEPAVSVVAAKPQLAWILAAFLVFTSAALGFVLFRQRPTPSPQVFRTTIEPPPKTRLTNFALSPDGRFLAIAATGAHGDQIWVRSLDSFQVQPLVGTEGGEFPFWSSDSRSIGFFAEEKLKRISADGGPVQTVCDAPNARGGTWNSQNVIVFGSNITGLRRVNSAGGDPTRLEGKNSGNSPTFLPDGRRFLYEATGKERGVYLGSLDAVSGAGETLITPDASNPQYLPPSAENAHGYILFVHEDTLMAKPVDPNSLAPAGDPFPIFDQVSSLPGDNTYFLYSLSRNGMIVHQPTRLLQHTILDRGGRPLATIGDPIPTQGRVALSPDGKRIIFERGVRGKIDLWMTELDRGSSSRLTFDPSMNLSPIWSPEGIRVAFSSNRSGNFDLYLTASNQAGRDRVLWRTGETTTATDWTRDGRFLIVEKNGVGSTPGASLDLFAVPADGGMPVTLLNSAANEMEGVVSPDGHWLAYVSDESGRDEVYVQPFAPGSSQASGGKSQISTEGGRDPHWRGNGSELFYVSSDRKMMSVSMRPGHEGLEHGSPQPLFDVHFYTDVTLSRYAVSADGQRFLAAIPIETFSEGLIHLTVNWLATVKK